MMIVPSANAPSVVALHVAEPSTVAASAPNVVVPTPVGSAANVSVGVSIDSTTPQPPAQPRDLLSHLTTSDRDVIAAATGVQLNAGDVVTEARSSGVPPWGLIMALAMDRKSGALQGEISPAYLSAVFARHENAEMPFHPQYLSAALLFLRSQGSSAPQPPAAPVAAPVPSALSRGKVNVFG
jgi:hypothetical protein